MTPPEILTIEEVANMLRVSERTVYEWAQKGTIPGGKIGTSWRFKRAEVEKWLDDKLAGRKKRPSAHPVAIIDILSSDRVLILNCDHKKDALDALIDILARAPEINNRGELAKEIYHREELMSTGIGFGVGVPHVRLDSVSDTVMAMGVSQSDIKDYASLDGKPVRIICMIASGKYQHTKYIKALAQISSLLKEESVREAILAAPDAKSIYAIMVSEGS